MIKVKKELITMREREILKFMKDGLTGKEASKRFFLSQSTIKTHLRSAYKKLEANDRLQAISKAIEQGYFELE